MTDTEKPKSNVVNLASRRKGVTKADFDQKLHVLIVTFLNQFAESEEDLHDDLADLIFEHDPAIAEDQFENKMGAHSISLTASLIAYMASMYCADKESAHEFAKVVIESAHNMIEEDDGLED